MPTALEEAWWGKGRTGAQLPGEQQTAFRGTVGYTGPGDVYTKKEFQKGKKTYKKSGQDFGSYLSAVAGSIGVEDLGAKVQQKLGKKGYKEFEGYYTTKAPVTASGIASLAQRGFEKSDVQKYIADRFKNEYLSSEVRNFMGPDYKVNPETGKWEKIDSIISVDTPTGGTQPTITGAVVPSGSGIYAGLDPDTMKGATPYEMQYATLVDPYKIQAKSAERIARVGQGTALYGLIGNVI